MIGRATEEVLGRAMGCAARLQHEYFTVEHIFWSLLENPKVQEALEACGGDPSFFRKEIEKHLELNIPKIQNQGQPPVATLGVQRLIQRALFHVQSAGKDEIQPVDLLIAIFQSKESESLHLMAKHGIHRLDVLNYVAHGIGGAGGEGVGAMPVAPGENSEAGATNNVQDFLINLNERAKAGKIDVLVGRQNEVDRMIQILCRRRKNNPLLVGEAGVGKTALVEGLALRIIGGEVPDLLLSATLYSLDLGGLLAGTKFRGDFENRVKVLLNFLKKKPDAILFIDEIHAIIGAGAVSGGAMDGANLLKPLLAQGELRCIGSTTYKEYRNIFDKDHALSRRFQKIDVIEPTVEETVQILTGLKSKFEEFHGVSYTAEALRSAAELSAKHITDRFLPDKAIDVIDEAGSLLKLARVKASAKSSTDDKAVVPSSVIDRHAIEEIVSKIARVPAKTVNVSQKERLKNIERDLRLVIFGQDEAIDAVTASIRLARSGLRTGERPIGCFLFCGPTGVGKTELCKQLSRSLGVPFQRFDMSEYMEKHSVSRLIGAPPGYVGFEQEGLLTEAAIKNPHSVILLDEVEKAHPDLWNILLQVMDHGTLTDNNGRKADFRNTILIMTSNVGSRELDRQPLGLGGMSSGAHTKPIKAVEQTFSPEFRNRLDAIVYFNPLSRATTAEVLNKFLVELESQLLAKHVELDVSETAREWIMEKGYDKFLGARPMNRVIQDQIKKPLSEQLLFGKLEHGGSVKVTVKEGALHFTYRSSARATRKIKKGQKALAPVSGSGEAS